MIETFFEVSPQINCCANGCARNPDKRPHWFGSGQIVLGACDVSAGDERRALIQIERDVALEMDGN